MSRSGGRSRVSTIVGNEAQDLIRDAGREVGEMAAHPECWYAGLRSGTRALVWSYFCCGRLPHFAPASAVVLFRESGLHFERDLGNGNVVCNHVAVSSCAE